MAADSFWSSVVFLSHLDGTSGGTTLSDVRGHTMSVVGSGVLSSAQFKSGTVSYYQAPGGDNYVSIGTPDDISFTAEQYWALEAWVHPVEAGTTYNVLSVLNAATQGLIQLALAFGTPTVSLLNSDLSTTTVSGGSAPTDAWTHIAVVRNGANIELFVGGSSVGSATLPTTNLAASYNGKVYLGVDMARLNAGSSSRSFRGYFDGVRITFDARYTAGFTPQSTYDGPPMLSGTVRDASNALVARVVRAYRRSDGILIGQTTSDASTGVFSIATLDATAHTVIVLDNGTPDENALIFDSEIPV